MPIIQEHGRWRSVRTPDERKTATTDLVAKLNPRERTMLQKILNDYQTTGKSGIVGEVAEIEWDEQPMPVAEWLMNEELIGETGHDMYPQLRADMVELFEGDYHEAILCLHPQTGVPLLDGTTPTIEELAVRWKSNPEPFWLYAVVDGEIVPAQGVQPRQTGEDDYFKVTLDDGTTFTGNARHQMVMRDGTKRMIRDMSPGDSITPFEVKLSSKADGDRIEGYEKHRLLGGEWVYTHRRVAKLLVEKEDGNEDTAHHVNFKKTDNSPTNLKWMRWVDHFRYHAGLIQTWREANPERAAQVDAKAASHLAELWAADDGSRQAAHSVRMTERNLAGNASEAGKLAWKNRSPEAKAEFHEMMVERNRLAGDRRLDVTVDAIRASGATSVKDAAAKLSSSPTRIRRVLAQHGFPGTSFFGDRRGKRRDKPDVTVASIKTAIEAGSLTPGAVAERLCCERSTIYRVLKRDSLAWSDLCAPVHNHYVVKVEPAGRGPVYCLSVPSAGNFAISTSSNGKEVPTRRAGVFSSNTGAIGWG